MVDICGSFTTFSAFDFQALTLVRDGDWLRASAIIAATLFVSCRGIARPCRRCPQSLKGGLIERCPAQIPKQAMLLRVFISKNDRHGHQPPSQAIVLKAREMHLAGAAVP
jgi:hypothetical protein